MKNNNSAKYLVYGAAAVMIVLFIIGLGSMKGDSSKKEQQVMMPSPSIEVRKKFQTGAISLSLAAGQTSIKVGQPVDIVVKADSAGRSVTDYDIVFENNPNAFEIRDVKTSLSDFSISPYQNTSVYTVTGYQSFGPASPTVFKDTAIAVVTIVPKTAGSMVFKSMSTLNKATTKLIDSDGEILFPTVGQLSIAVSK